MKSAPLNQWDQDPNGWRIEHSIGPGGAFHHRPLPDPLRPTLWVHRTDRPALVLGSTQSDAVLFRADAESAGYEVCRRRSGGGLVVIDPATSLWIDALVPPGHHLWHDDIGKAFAWFGQVWATALRSVLPDDHAAVVVHEGAAVAPAHGRFLCFAGLGHGEVTIDGVKVVGLSQRRTREGARIQAMAIQEWDSVPLEQFTRPHDRPEGLRTAGELAAVSAGHPFNSERLLAAVIEALPPA